MIDALAISASLSASPMLLMISSAAAFSSSASKPEGVSGSGG
jgi:hypothetical protein